MKETPGYPENRLDIRVDEQGKISYEQNAVFAQYYAPTWEEKEEELEQLKDRLELLDLDEPDDLYSEEHDDWEDIRRGLTEAIEDLEDEISEMD